MEQAWVFETLAVTVARVDFHDPALADDPSARERGVRVEVRPVGCVPRGSVYGSPGITLQPAVCRIDLLESSPGAADRMHWHPGMVGGEPGDRVFDADLPRDPLTWLGARLAHLDDLLAGGTSARPDGPRAGVGVHGGAHAVAGHAEQILDAVRDGLRWARGPWPDVQHDERGMATT